MSAIKPPLSSPHDRVDDLGGMAGRAACRCGRKKLTTFILGSDQERALRSAAASVTVAGRPDDSIACRSSTTNSSGPLIRMIGLVILHRWLSNGHGHISPSVFLKYLGW
jgi:hypothetical protein